MIVYGKILKMKEDSTPKKFVQGMKWIYCKMKKWKKVQEQYRTKTVREQENYKSV